MLNPIKSIVKFNHDAGLTDKPYDDFLESSFQIEEALEGFQHLDTVAFKLGMDSVYPSSADEVNQPKEISRWIVASAQHGKDSPNDKPVHEYDITISDVDRLDKACDAVVYAIGSMAKLGLDAQQITKALNTVMVANNAKLNCPKDEFGKLMKPDNFEELYAPEPKLQQILDER